ncbi:MAG: ATP-binding cassette domain-containing protein [Mycobacterium sp.]|nr:ATP-binding cassette domain-containing protein [Mycobacterium sp.]
MTSTRPDAPARVGRSLTPVEMAQAAVMGSLSSALSIASVVVPFAGGLALLVTVPMGLLALRYRFRVLVAAAFAASSIAFLIAGISGFMVVLNCAYVGGMTGIIKRRGRGTPAVIVASIVAGAILGLISVALLIFLERLRTVTFEAITANIDGVVRVLSLFGEPFRESAEEVRALFELGLMYWPVFIMAYSIFSIVVVSLIGWFVLAGVLERLSGIPDVHKLDATDDAEGGPIAPLPVRLVDVRFRYPNADHDALRPLSLAIDVGEHVAITGANGSGKTTLMLLLCGRQPTSGRIERPGAVGLGHAGGTSVVLQHPESQVLGARVADDVVWGLPPGTKPDVGRLLDEVGLTGMAERDTGGLSGGELQRLAVAAALAREPSLLIADEVTSMVDQRGREALLGLLSGLTERHRMGLVHITHYRNEADNADRIINLSASADNMVMVAPVHSSGPAAAPTAGPAPETAPGTTVGRAAKRSVPVLQLDGVGHEYAMGTPWSKTALRDVSFTVNEGDGVLIHGGNGSGKSTLAWIMAGLTRPTSGRCLVRGRPAHESVGEVAIAFQAARLQLLRSRVDLEVASAAGFSQYDTERVVSALATVGLDGSLARRRIDQLSGGQMRRVVIAGLLARWPQALILDEPLAGLDADSQRGLLGLLTDLRRNAGLTVVVISHDFVGLQDLCPRILHFDRGRLTPASGVIGGSS